MLHDILHDDHIQWHPPLIGHYTNFWPLLIWTLLPNLTFYLIVQGFHRNICNGCGMPTEDAYSSGHLVLPLSGLVFVLLVETSDTKYRLDFMPVCDIFTRLNILLNLTYHQILVSIEHLQRVWHADRGRLLLRTPGPVPLWDLHVF